MNYAIAIIGTMIGTILLLAAVAMFVLVRTLRKYGLFPR